MEELTGRQEMIYKFIVKEIKEKGYPPSVREIGSAVGLKSPASVHNHLKTLEKLDFLRRDPSKPRAIEVLKAGVYSEQNNVNKEMLQIPLVGRVTAGEPILADQNIEDYFPIPADYIRASNNELFMLEVSGDSMINAGIHDCDYVIAQRQQIAQDHDIVIALLDDEATVKRFFRDENAIRLQPENPDYKPIISTDIKILGKVIGLFRRFSI